VKRRSKILIGVLALGIACVLLLMVTHDNVRDKVAAYKQELRAKGEKLTFAELAPPPSTKTPNGAKALTNVINYTSSSMNVPQMMLMVAPGIARIGHTNIGAELMFNYENNVQRAAELRAILTNAAVLDFNLDYSDIFDFQLTYLSKLKAAEIVVSTTAMQALYKKDYTEAWPDLCAGVDLVRLFDSEPMGISQLVRYAMTGTATAATWEALQENEWTEAQLLELQSNWEATDLLSLLERVMTMERADSVEASAKARKSWETIYGPTPFGGPAGGNLREKFGYLYDRYPRYWRWKFSSWSYEQELYYLQITTAAVEASRAINVSGAFLPALNEFHHQAANIDKLYPDRSNHFLLDIRYERYCDTYFRRLALTEAGRRLLVTAIALKRFHLQNGAYPTNLNELVPNYLKQMPLDFMDGKPLRYRLRADGDFLLYSVGEDGEDNGGEGSPVGSGTFGNWLAARDIVWPRAATPALMADYFSRSGNETNAPSK
jgi:hypothetical protein